MLNTWSVAHITLNIQHLDVSNEVVTRDYRPIFKRPPAQLMVQQFLETRNESLITHIEVKTLNWKN
jgi:hypothetical protein